MLRRPAMPMPEAFERDPDSGGTPTDVVTTASGPDLRFSNLLAALAGAGLPWGIVTNKAARFAEPLVQGLGLHAGAAALVCGDTTPHAKPHPAPLHEAARRLGRPPGSCVYVGDDLRDVQAGRAAGMATLVAGWGYMGQGDAAHDWGADAVLAEPGEILNWLRLP